MKVEKVRGNTYIVDIYGTSTGIYKLSESEAVMIDSGREFAPELFMWLNRKKLRVVAVIHTHLHIDHVANTDELVSEYKAKAMASEYDVIYEGDSGPQIEAPIMRVAANSNIKIGGRLFKTIHTPGHCQGHQLVVTPDGVCFVGDALVTEDLLEGFKFPYQVNAEQFLDSLEVLRNTDYPVYVASHKGIIKASDINRLIDMNREKNVKLYEIIEDVAINAVERLTVEQLADRAMLKAGVTNPVVRGYSWMKESAAERVRELINRGVLALRDGRVTIGRNVGRKKR